MTYVSSNLIKNLDSNLTLKTFERILGLHEKKYPQTKQLFSIVP